MRTSRREFLLGKSMLDQLTNPILNSNPPLPTHADHITSSGEQIPGKMENFVQSRRGNHSANYWEEYSKRAMACQFEVLLNLHQYPQGAMAVGQAFDLIDTIEDQLTVYRDSSEVSLVNRTAYLERVEVHDRLYQILATSVELYNHTSGAFDITAAPLSELWGFVKRSGKIPNRDDIKTVLNSVGCDKIELDAEHKTVRFLHPQVKINLGGIGKGFALDQVQKMLLEMGIGDFVVHGGQSSVIAIGSDGMEQLPRCQITEKTRKVKQIEPGASPDKQEKKDLAESNGSAAIQEFDPQGWRVGISHPILPQYRLAEIDLRNQALGTSGSARQGFYAGGKRYGHIIDPRTGWPGNQYLSATVLAPSAALADALATAFFLMPPDQIANYCQRFPDTSALMIAVPHQSNEKNRTDELLLQTFNLNLDQLNLLQN